MVSTRKRKYIIIVVDYFSKQIEPKAPAFINEFQVIKFFITNIFSWYGVSRTLISDNGPQFMGT